MDEYVQSMYSQQTSLLEAAHKLQIQKKYVTFFKMCFVGYVHGNWKNVNFNLSWYTLVVVK